MGRPAKPEHGWFAYPHAVYRDYGSRIGPVGLAVYGCIASHLNFSGISPTPVEVAKEIGVSRATVYRAIQALRECMLIETHRQSRGSERVVFSIPEVPAVDVSELFDDAPPVSPMRRQNLMGETADSQKRAPPVSPMRRQNLMGETALNRKEESTRKDEDSSEPDVPASELPLRWGKPPIQFEPSPGRFVGITDLFRATWREAYPALDLDRELAAAGAWIIANPAKGRKGNYARFLTNWLSRSQDRAGPASGERDRPAGGRVGSASRVSAPNGKYSGVGETIRVDAPGAGNQTGAQVPAVNGTCHRGDQPTAPGENPAGGYG